MKYVPLLGFALFLIASASTAAPVKEWDNPTDRSTEVVVAPSPVRPVALEIGGNKRPLRALPFQTSREGITVTVPPHSKVQLWARSALAGAPDEGFARAARYGAFPLISVGPVVVDSFSDPRYPVETPAWQTDPGRFRAYPEGTLPVSVKVRNDAITPWKNPRVRLFAPDTWKILPATGPLVDGRGRPLKSLAPGASALAAFSVVIPRQSTLGAPATLVAFLRFEAGSQTVTVRNNVDVTLQEPVERRYAMSEKGDRFVVHLINRFTPAVLGRATVEVRKPAGTNWEVTQPPVTLVKAADDATAPVKGVASPTDQIGVPVVVTLNGFRMGYTPLAAVLATYGAEAAEKGLKRLPLGSPTTPTADGLCFADAPGTDHVLSLDVADKFIVSDPQVYVSPTWITVDLVNRGANRIRLEYDAFGSDRPTLAGDLPVDAKAAQETFSFLIPDARFANGLPGKADLRLILSGGNACIQRITVTKWNPLKTER